MAQPELSVVIPTYNRCELTLHAVASVLAQQGAWRSEVIVAIDGSTDDTERALRERYGDDARVRALVLPRGGASAARNAGFRAVRGNWVCFLDSDDYWLPGTQAAFERLFAAFPELAFASLDGATIPRAGVAQVARLVAGHSPGWSHARFAQVCPAAETYATQRTEARRLLRGDFFPAIVLGDLFYLSGMVMRRDAAAAAGPFTERFRYFNDWEFFARLCLQGTGAYLEVDGFRRDTGRPDQISRRRPATAMPRRHLYILRSVPRRFPQLAARHAQTLRAAFDDASYMMGRALAGSAHRRWARRYLAHCLRRGYKPARSLALLLQAFLRQ